MDLWSLPDSWGWKRLGSVAGDTERRNPGVNPNEYFRYVDIASVDNDKGEIRTGDVQSILGRSAPSRARKVIRGHDIVFATTRPYLRNIAIVPQELDSQICSTGFCVVRARSGISLPDFLYYACRSSFFIEQLLPKQRGATYPAVADSEVYDTLLPVPYPDDPARSLETQRRIVARIEALFAEVAEARRLHSEIVADTGRVIEAAIRKVFDQPVDGWKTHQLSEVAFVQTGTAKGRHFGDRKTVELPYLRVANVQAGYLNLDEIKTIRIAENESDRYRLQPGDLLLTEGGDFDKLGRGAVWRGEIELCIHQNHIFAVRLDQNVVLPEFAEYEMLSWHAKRYFLGVAKKTTNLATINSTQLAAFPMKLPEMQEQQRIVAHLDLVKQQSAELQAIEIQNGTLLAEMEQSILAQAFRGEL
jgi:type I restriction enzyme, S subunit